MNSVVRDEISPLPFSQTDLEAVEKLTGSTEIDFDTIRLDLPQEASQRERSTVSNERSRKGRQRRSRRTR